MKCFNCGREGHKKKDCRLPPKQQNGFDRTKAPINKPNPTPASQADKGKTKLYVVEVEEDDDEARIVEDTILIHGNKINVLFDSGCTNSFISS